MTRLNPQELARFRSIAAAQALVALAPYAKRDISFVPTKAIGTERWHACAGGREFELLLNGVKFFDVRANTGGGGAIDLAIHLYRGSFNDAIALLQQRGL